MKKLLYLSDLYNFYVSQNKNVKFSSKDNDTTIVIHVDEPFTYSKTEEDDDLNMYCPIRLCHTLTNRNKSHISEKAMKDAIPTAYNMPILGYIYKDDNDEFQFAGHEFFVNDNNEIEYEEHPCGTIPESAELKLVNYDGDDRSYLEGTGIIWRTYSRASDIIEREQSLSVSVELMVDELSFDSKNKELIIDKFRFSGVTILGKDRDTGDEIQPGMENSKISISDFSESNNSVFSQNEKDIEMLSALNEKIDNLNINNEILEEGGNPKPMFEKLLEQYGKSIDEIDFEYEGLSDEELEAVFAEHFTPSIENFEDSPKKRKKSEDDDSVIVDDEDQDDDDEDQDDEDEDDDKDDDDKEDQDDEENPDDKDDTPEVQSEEEEQPEESDDNTEEPEDVDYYSVNYTVSVKGSKKDFSVSLKEKLNALTILVNDTYGESDGAWYDCDVIEETKTVEFHDWWSNKHYRQSYSVKKDVYSLKGDRIETFVSFLSSDEKNALEQMKANYSSIEEKLQQYESEPEKLEVLASEEYSQIKDTDAYKELAKRDTYFSMSKDELVEKLDACLLEFAKHNRIEFSATESEKKSVGVKKYSNLVNRTTKGSSRYGGIFNK